MLHISVKNNALAIVKLLLKAGADVNVQDVFFIKPKLKKE